MVSKQALFTLILLLYLPQDIILQWMSNIISVGEVKTVCNPDSFESLHILSLFFFALWRAASLNEERLNDNIFDLINWVTTDFRYFFSLCNQHYVESLQKLNETHQPICLFHNLLLHVNILQVLIQLASVKYFSVFFHDVFQSNVTIRVRPLLQFDHMQLTLHFVTSN